LEFDPLTAKDFFKMTVFRLRIADASNYGFWTDIYENVKVKGLTKKEYKKFVLKCE